MLLALFFPACAPPLGDSDGEPEAGPAPGWRFVFGDLHVHTGASGDGCASDVAAAPEAQCGALAEVAAEAAASSLDFLALTDHTDGPQVWEGDAGSAAWRATVEAAFAGSNEDFLAFPGAEINTTITASDGTAVPLGHKSVVFFGEEAELSGITRADASPNEGRDTDVGTCEELWKWAIHLQEQVGPLVLFPHHPAVTTPMPTDFSCFDDSLMPAVELYSHFGSSRILGTPEPDYDPLLDNAGSVQVGTPSGTIQYLLTEYPEVRTSFLAGSDAHNTHAGDVCHFVGPEGTLRYAGGLTGAWIPEGGPFTREALREAIVTHHTLASSGPRVPVWVRWLDSGGETAALAGEEVGAAAVATVRVEVPEPFSAEVSAVWAVAAGAGAGAESNSQIPQVEPGVWQLDVAPEPGSFRYITVALAGPESHPDGCSDGGDDTERVWVSPTWFR